MKPRIRSMIGYSLVGLFFLTGLFFPVQVLGDTPVYTQEDCMECHTKSDESVLQISLKNHEASVHGQAVTCLECHTGIIDEEHMDGEEIDSVDCKECHEMETGKIDLFSIFSSSQITTHKKANFQNIYEIDNCLGCHQGIGAHGEKAPINDQDCYKCHDPNIKNPMWGYIHPETKEQKLTIVLAHISLALVILVLLFGQFLVPVFNNFLKKLK
jgi:hypothetical protein